MNVLALVKDSERYVFMYDDASTPQLLETLGRFARDKELSFTWFDAAVLAQKARQQRQALEQKQLGLDPKGCRDGTKGRD